MLDKLVALRQHPRIKQLSDIRNVGLYVFGVLVLLVSWSGVKVIQDNYKLQREIAKLAEENKVAELENETERLRNQYLETDHYLELSARRQFGKAAEGETVYLVPKEVALRHAVTLSGTEESMTAAKTGRSNFQAWMDFILHRQSD